MKKRKIKTKRAVAKRFKITANHKVVHKRSGTNHFGRRKRGNRKRALRTPNVLGTADAHRVRKALGKIK
ncbi:50S ribosomal protein L35 [bacterium]|nr:50S ribosomal protein L35 [bacterium]